MNIHLRSFEYSPHCKLPLNVFYTCPILHRCVNISFIYDLNAWTYSLTSLSTLRDRLTINPWVRQGPSLLASTFVMMCATLHVILFFCLWHSEEILYLHINTVDGLPICIISSIMWKRSDRFLQPITWGNPCQCEITAPCNCQNMIYDN